MRITLKGIEESIAPLGGRSQYDREFIFELLRAYGRSSSNITRLKNGSLNVADDPAEDVAQKNIVFFRPVTRGENLYATIDALRSDQTVVRYSTRFVIVTDYKQLLAIDTKTNETLDTPVKEVNKYFTFFLPWAGMEKSQYVAENHVDIKAAYKMSKLFDEIVSYNHHAGKAEYYHSLNVFFCRLLFCFFAEDTEIFEKGQFTRGMESHTQTDGSDLAEYLDELFFALDAEDKEGYPSHIRAFPYVNGGLFHVTHKAPLFNAKARNLIIECGKLNWSDINPDIFGSMIQTVVNPGQRATLGMHYTSVPNIMKTIEPLFLDDLKEEFNNHYDNKNKLEKLLGRIGNIKVFDPACGSGNFLIIAYKELRKLEHALLERIDDLTPHQTNRVMFSRISIENFYGIEIDDFAHEVAILSLWLAKHQMNLEFKQKFGVEIPLIPLREVGNIVHGNAAKLDWNEICPNRPGLPGHARLQQSKLIENEHEQAELLRSDEKQWNEIYLISNPPYQGFSQQDSGQKEDLKHILGTTTKMDYISCWFIKASDYIKHTRAKLSFVSTNSICQGEQVALLWPRVLVEENEIEFAYTSFKWTNSAKNVAGVTVVIIGIAPSHQKKHMIITDNVRQEVEYINPYLTSTKVPFITKRASPISQMPRMVLGDMPNDFGYLQFTDAERNSIVGNYPYTTGFFRRVLGSQEFIKGQIKWCIWVDENQAKTCDQVPELHGRFKDVWDKRAASKKVSYNKFASRPYRFIEIRHKETDAIIVPGTSSERREYIPMGLVDKSIIINNLAFAVYNAEIWMLGLLTSRMHMVWIRNVCGSLETRLRYSSVLGYNTFPVRLLNTEDMSVIEHATLKILDSREHHSEQTLAELYDPNKMPDDLRNAHEELDKAVDNIYRDKPFETDEERLAHLFNLYEQMVSEEKGSVTP
jgi:hypothetical protein